MEQNVSAGTSEVPVTYDKQESGNGLKIATAIACVVATCGVGFWHMGNDGWQGTERVARHANFWFNFPAYVVLT